MSIAEYLFYPNLGTGSYTSTNVSIILGISALFVIASIVSRVWRKKQQNSVMRKLTKSWPSSFLWFGIVGAVLAVSRVEGIQFVSMRVWTLVWAACFLLFALFQTMKFRRRYYEVIPQVKTEDPKDRYLPKKKK